MRGLRGCGSTGIGRPAELIVDSASTSAVAVDDDVLNETIDETAEHQDRTPRGGIGSGVAHRNAQVSQYHIPHRHREKTVPCREVGRVGPARTDHDGVTRIGGKRGIYRARDRAVFQREVPQRKEKSGVDIPCPSRAPKVESAVLQIDTNAVPDWDYTAEVIDIRPGQVRKYPGAANTVGRIQTRF